MKKIFKKLTAIMAATIIAAASTTFDVSAATTYSYNLHNSPGAPSSEMSFLRLSHMSIHIIKR